MAITRLMKNIITTILTVLCIGIILFAYQSGRAIAESTDQKSPETTRENTETPQPKKDQPAEAARDKNETPAKKPAPDEKPTPPAEMSELYKTCDAFLSKHVNENGTVNYAKLRRKRSDLFNAVRVIQQVEPLEYLQWTDDEKVAFWINAYNIFTLKLVIDNYPIEARWYMILYPANCIMQIPKGRQKLFFDIIGLEYSIREIEFEMLLDRFEDLRVIFALTYASNSGAFLSNRAYTPSKLDEQLDEQVRRFLSSDRGLKIDRKKNIVYISGIFNWYKKYFIASKYSQTKKFRKHPEYIRSYLNFIF